MADESPPEVKFFYEKSNFFRVVHANGVYGGVSPQGYLNIAFYSERYPIPKETALDLVNGRSAGKPERVVDVKNGVFREVEVDVAMDLHVALAFRGWLNEKIEALRVQQGLSDEDWQSLVSQYAK